MEVTDLFEILRPVWWAQKRTDVCILKSSQCLLCWRGLSKARSRREATTFLEDSWIGNDSNLYAMLRIFSQPLVRLHTEVPEKSTYAVHSHCASLCRNMALFCHLTMKLQDSNVALIVLQFIFTRDQTIFSSWRLDIR